MLRYSFAFALMLSAVSVFAAAREQGPSSKSLSARPDITLFVLPDCGYCERARVHLRNRGRHWQELDISSSAAIEKRFVELGGQGTPLIVIGEQRIHGFQPARIDAALAAP